MSDSAALTATIKAFAGEAGFAAVGIAAADAGLHAEVFRAWLLRGCHGGMAYMARNVAKRHRPTELVPGAQSVICLAVSYAPAAEPAGDVSSRATPAGATTTRSSPGAPVG